MRVPPKHPITRNSINSNHGPSLTITRGSPEAQEPTISNVRDATLHYNEESHSCASFFYACWKKLCKSVHTFFSYATYYLTCCFSRNSFEDVTQHRDPSTSMELELKSLISKQNSVAEILRDVENKQNLIKEIIECIDSCQEFYNNQQEFLDSYLSTLDAALKDLGDTVASSSATKDQGEASTAHNLFDNENINLFNRMKCKAEALIKLLENNKLLKKTNNNLLSQMKELFSPSKETCREWSQSGRLTTKLIIFYIPNTLDVLNKKKSSYQSLQEDLNNLVNKNALDSKNQLPSSSINYVDGDIQSLCELSKEQLQELKDKYLETNKGLGLNKEFETNMRILQKAIKAFGTSIADFKQAKSESENVSTNQNIRNRSMYGKRTGI